MKEKEQEVVEQESKEVMALEVEIIEPKKLTIFTPQIIEPVEKQYIDLGEEYETVKKEFTQLIDSVKDIEVTEEYLTQATEIQKQVNAMWNGIETARKQYHNQIDEIFYKPIAEKIEKEIKVKFQEWESTFKKSKLEVEKKLLDDRIESISKWFDTITKEAGLEFLALEDAIKYGNVKITRKNSKNDIAKNCNAFIDKVKSDVNVLSDGYGEEEKAEYIKTFDMSIAIATVRERKREIEQAKEVQAKVETPLVSDIPKQEVAAKQEVISDAEIMTRIWEVQGTKEQLTKLAMYIKENGIAYKVRKDLI